MNAAYQISQLTTVTEQELVDINLLLKQLSKSGRQTTLADLREVMAGSRIRVAREGGRIIGMVVLTPSVRIGCREGRILDMVVDEAHRSKGIGKELAEAVVADARAIGLKRLDFSSSFHRVAANTMYQKMGFKQRETNVYRLEL